MNLAAARHSAQKKGGGAGSVRSVVIVLQSTAIGGMEMHCRYHAAELVRRGVGVTVVAPRAAEFHALAGLFAREGSTVVRLDTDARHGRLRQAGATVRLVGTIRRTRADVVHLHTGGATGGLLAVAAARLGSPATVVVTEHDVPAWAPRRWDRWTRRAMDRLTGLPGVRVAAQRRAPADAARPRESQAGQCAQRGAGFAHPDEVARNRREVRRRLQIDEDAVVVGSLVRLAPGKGLHDLLRAFARVAGRTPPPLAAGGGPPGPDGGAGGPALSGRRPGGGTPPSGQGGAGGPALPGRRPRGGTPPSGQGGAGGPALPGRRPRGGTPPSGQGGSPATLLLVGDGPLRDELAALAHELGIGGLVRFAGHQAEPTPFVDAMDVFVLAVPAGSMSIALLETMARGVPPVITFCGPEEAVIDEQTGLCAPPDDPVGLGCALERLAADAGLRRRMGAAAAEHVGSEFSAARVADDLLAVYGVRTGGLPDRLRVAQG